MLSAVSVLVVAQSSSEIPEGLMNNPVYFVTTMSTGLVVNPDLHHETPVTNHLNHVMDCLS